MYSFIVTPTATATNLKSLISTWDPSKHHGGKSVITIQSDTGNGSSRLVVGDANVVVTAGATVGILLLAGDSYTLEGVRVQDVWLRADAEIKAQVNLHSMK